MNEPNNSPENPSSDEGWYGIFYYNSNDSRVMVPRRWGIGWTVNFAQPMAYVVIGVPLLCGLAIAASVCLAKYLGAI